MVSSSDDIFSVAPSRLVIAPGATNALFVATTPGEKALLLKYYTGGTLEILQCSAGASYLQSGTTFINWNTYQNPTAWVGSTQTAAMLIALSGTGYLMGTSESLTFDGPTQLYLNNLSTGTTTIVMCLRGLAAGV